MTAMATPEGDGHEPAGRSAGPVLIAWAVLTVALNGATWTAGFRDRDLALAIESGAARIESRRVGEVDDEPIRKAIRLQQGTWTFWATLAALSDFLVAPLVPTLRAATAATSFAALAALTGRPIGFGLGLRASAWAQGYWVTGLAVRTGLMLGLRRADVETSLALALPPGTYPALTVLALQQVDAFAGLGWLALARGAWRRGQTNLVVAGLVVGLLALAEATFRITAGAALGAGMRLTILPE